MIKCIMGIFDLLKAKKIKNNTPSATTPFADTVQKKVLIVEDEDELANALVSHLTSHGLVVRREANGKTGLEALSDFKPDVLVLDINMPEMNGLAMLSNIRNSQDFKDLPVVVLTNHGTYDNMRDTNVLYGVHSFLIKSNVSLDEVLNSVNSLINK